MLNLTAGLAPAVRVEPAYDDIDQVRELVQRESPYPVIATLYGYANMYGGIGEKTFPWYRSYWALDGKPTIDDPEVAAILGHEPFIHAARRIFTAEVVRPQTLLVNLMAPMETGAPHMDAPSFRGLQRDECPIWLVVAMGASGLFERWSVSVAGAISWLYDGLAGEFEYWPDGPDHASRLEPAPFHNVALVADNDRMYHRVREIGTLAARKSLGDVPTASEMRWTGEAWEITCDDQVIAAYAPEAMRISLLWKAMVFREPADAARFDDHSDDIEIGQIVDIFRADLDARGIHYESPTDPLEDPQWAATLNGTYRI